MEPTTGSVGAASRTGIEGSGLMGAYALYFRDIKW